MSACPLVTTTTTFKPKIDSSITIPLSSILTVQNIVVTPSTFYGAGQTLSISFDVLDNLPSTSNSLFNISQLTPVITAPGSFGTISPASGSVTLSSSTGFSQTFTVPYVVSATDVTNASITFNINATGTLIQISQPLSTISLTSSSSSKSVSYVPIVLTTTATSNVTSFITSGTSIVITYVTSGNGTVNFGATGLTAVQSGLSPGFNSVTTSNTGPESYTTVATYITTSSDASSGSNLTIGFLPSVTLPNGVKINQTAPTIITITAIAAPSFSIAFTSPLPTYNTVGSFTVPLTITNIGNTSLQFGASPITSNITATTFTGLPSTLALSASTSCSAVFTITQANIDAGSIKPTLTMTSSSYRFGSNSIVTTSTVCPVSSTIFAAQTSLLTVTEPNMPVFFIAGQVYSFIVQVTNSGNTTVGNIAVTDSLSSIYVNQSSPVVTSIAPGVSIQFKGSYTITATDVTNKLITDAVTASGSVTCF